jgi:Family of unknown function (DUF5681)
MSRRVGPGRPPLATRFRKGESGNPKGRPKGRKQPPASAFEIVLDRRLTVTQNGKPRELTLEEALQLRTYRDALAGKRLAIRAVLKMIAIREKWLAAHAPKPAPVERVIEREPENANETLILLGIAEPDTRPTDFIDEGERLLLRGWAVQAALSRPGRRRLSAEAVAAIKRCTKNPDALRWPAGTRDEQDR